MRGWYLVSAAAALTLAGSALAQDFVEKRLPGETLVSELIGSPVHDRGDRELGEITDLILDPGRALTGVVIAVGDKEVAVPYRLLLAQVKDGAVRYVLSLNAEALAAAPAYVSEDESGRLLVPAPCGGQCPGDPMANPMPAN